MGASQGSTDEDVTNEGCCRWEFDNIHLGPLTARESLSKYSTTELPALNVFDGKNLLVLIQQGRSPVARDWKDVGPTHFTAMI